MDPSPRAWNEAMISLTANVGWLAAPGVGMGRQTEVSDSNGQSGSQRLTWRQRRRLEVYVCDGDEKEAAVARDQTLGAPALRDDDQPDLHARVLAIQVVFRSTPEHTGPGITHPP